MICRGIQRRTRASSVAREARFKTLNQVSPETTPSTARKPTARTRPIESTSSVSSQERIDEIISKVTLFPFSYDDLMPPQNEELELSSHHQRLLDLHMAHPQLADSFAHEFPELGRPIQKTFAPLLPKSATAKRATISTKMKKSVKTFSRPSSKVHPIETGRRVSSSKLSSKPASARGATVSTKKKKAGTTISKPCLPAQSVEADLVLSSTPENHALSRAPSEFVMEDEPQFDGHVFDPIWHIDSFEAQLFSGGIVQPDYGDFFVALDLIELDQQETW